MGEAMVVATVALLAGGLLVALIVVLRRKAHSAPVTLDEAQVMAERVRAVGKLVGLEVHAKEIATSTKGWSWVPPLLLSQAKVAMIFHFDKQYFVDLNRLSGADIEELAPGRYQLRMPEVEGTLRLSDLTPYDIQAGRVFALFDVIQMTANTQKELIRLAQQQAAALFQDNESRYRGEAERSIENQLRTLLGFFDVEVEFVWPGRTTPTTLPNIELAAPLTA
ncbi:MAG: DUF4230 domain-containing protein [Planctomycetota bacterium]